MKRPTFELLPAAWEQVEHSTGISWSLPPYERGYVLVVRTGNYLTVRFNIGRRKLKQVTLNQSVEDSSFDSRSRAPGGLEDGRRPFTEPYPVPCHKEAYYVVPPPSGRRYGPRH